MRSRHWQWLLLLCACCAHGAELARLTNGFDLRCERHEQMGSLTRLYLDAQGPGFIEIPTQRISGYEPVFEAPPQLPAQTSTIPEHIANAGLQAGIDPDFIHSVISAESGYNTKAVSPKGAQGLMQLMPATAAMLGVHDSFDPADNIDGGTRYLHGLLLRYKGDAIKALAAYNAGPESVEKYRGIPPYQETRRYVARVINEYNCRKLAASNTPVDLKHSQYPVREGKGVPKPRQTSQCKNAATRKARAGHPTNQTEQLPIGP
jgi:hypothetical protein